MTLDEAIKRYEKIAETQENDAKSYPRPNKNVKGSGRKYNTRIKCANEYRQLATWLKVLKEIWDSGDCNNCRNGQCKWKPKLGQLVRFNCPHYVGITNGEVNSNEDSD